MAKPTCYLAGPMTGYFEYNFPAFIAMATTLRKLGFEVISPAELDIEAGHDPRGIPAEEFAKTFTEAKLRKVIRRDINAILQLRPKRGDFIALMKGWERSRGAGAEVYAGAWARLPLRMIVTHSPKELFLVNITLPLPHRYTVDGSEPVRYTVE